MAITLAKAMFSALVMESIVYGFFLSTFFRTLDVLLFRNDAFKRRKVRWPFVFVTCMMFVCGTLDVAVHFKLNMDGLILYTGEGGPDAGLGRISQWVNPAHVRATRSYLMFVLTCGRMLSCRLSSWAHKDCSATACWYECPDVIYIP